MMIQIIGAGAIGCLWLAKLLQSAQICHIVSRQKYPSNQLNFTDLSGNLSEMVISHSQQLLNSNLTEQQSTILVCVKAPQVVEALLNQRQYINSQQAIILMHNGYGCAEQVQKHFPNNPIICSTTANGSLLTNPLTINHTGSGPTFLGYFKKQKSQQLENQPPVFFDAFEKAMKEVYWTENILEKCWLKLIINAVINPLTAINQINNGQLQLLPYRAQIQPLLIELVAIAKAESVHYEISYLQKTVSNVITATATNFSSMNRDIFYKRTTEIEFINGYLIKKAQQHNIAAPLLIKFYTQIKALEHHL